MKISFEVNPIDKHTKLSDLPIYCEGKLQISIEDKVFVEEDGVLLVEFAIAINNWFKKIKTGKKVDFYYESMDFEEAPILAFTFEDYGSGYIVSVFQKFEYNKKVEFKLIRKEFENYLVELETY